MNKNDTPIVKAEGVNASEKLLAQLCDKVFLKLWAYANPQKQKGDELCDVLAVFENHVFIFSDKNPSFKSERTTTTDLEKWKSWKSKAIDKSIYQIKRAEKWILKNPEKIFLDSQCTVPLPLTIDKENLKIHRIIVANGAEEACKNDSPNNINGSLAICYADLKGSPKTAKSPKPFHLILPRDDVIHVFDSYNLEIILGELDTVQDLLSYFKAKEEAIKKYVMLSHCGEENMLAHYFHNFDEELQEHYIGTKDDEHNVIIDERQDLWEYFKNSESYKIRNEANKISYFWDRLLQAVSQHALDKKLLGADVFNGQSALIEMAKESRLMRRIFSEAIQDAIQNYSDDRNRTLRTRHFMSDNTDRGYVLLQTPPYPNENYNESYRLRRRAMLEIACGVIKSKFPHFKKIIGIAIEPPRPNQGGSQGGSQEFLLLNDEDWTKEDEARYLQENKELGFNFFDGANLRTIKGRADEFPQ